MLKRLLLLIFLWGVLAPNLPVQAQNGGCDEAQRQAAYKLINATAQKFNDMRLVTETPDTREQYLQDVTRFVVEGEQIVSDYYTLTYPQFPDCAASIYMRDYAGIYFSSIMSSFVLLDLGSYSLIYGDPLIAQQLLDESDLHLNRLNQLPKLGDLLRQLEENSLYPDGLPPCGDLAQREMTKYAPLVAQYQVLQPAYETFIQTVSGEFETLFQFHTLAALALEVTSLDCAETYPQKVATIRLLIETDIVVHLLQSAAYTKVYGDETSAYLLQAHLNRHAGQVRAMQGIVFP